MKLNNLKKYSPLLLRTSIAIIFFWFGFSQLKDPSGWIMMLPEFLQTHGNLFVYLNGSFEIVFGILLVLGLYTRFVSFILGLHLLSIAFFVVSGPTSARDFALSLATFAIFFNGPDEYCFDEIIKEKKHKKEHSHED